MKVLGNSSGCCFFPLMLQRRLGSGVSAEIVLSFSSLCNCNSEKKYAREISLYPYQCGPGKQWRKSGAFFIIYFSAYSILLSAFVGYFINLFFTFRYFQLKDINEFCLAAALAILCSVPSPARSWCARRRTFPSQRGRELQEGRIWASRSTCQSWASGRGLIL